MASASLHDKVLLGILIIYLIYSVGAIGLTGLLFSAAFGLILNGFGYSNELSLAGLVLSGVLYKLWIDRRREGFEGGAPTGTGDTGLAIQKKIEQITRKNAFEPTGVLSSNSTEGFADVTPNPTPGTPPEASQAQAQAQAQPTAPSTSSPAPTNAPTVSVELAKQLPTTNQNASTLATVTPPAPANKAGFADPSTQGMFQLGSIPPDVIGGAHVDVGTTLMNALNSLKPDQVKQMTEDTKKLMETQKSLMGMLGTMKPMLTDGKEMMETFSQMFGKN